MLPPPRCCWCVQALTYNSTKINRNRIQRCILRGAVMTKTKVLIALDGSAWSRQILTPIRRLLSTADHELLLLRVAELPKGIVGAPPRPIAAGWLSSMYENKHDLEYSLHPI